MKTTLGSFLAISIFVIAASLHAHAQTNAVSCYEAGRSQTSLDSNEIMQLCNHQDSAAPINCFQSSHQTTSLSDDQLIRLCAGASNNTAVNCFNKAHAETSLSNGEALSMCGATSAPWFPTFTGVVPMMTPGPWQPAQ